MATLADYEDKVESIPAGGGKFAGDLKELPDGEYEFGISHATYKTVEKSGSELVELKLECLTSGPFEGKKFQHPYWLTDKDGALNEVSVGILKKDLATLGFDVENWTRGNNRGFFGELKKALKIMSSGLQFSAKKGMKGKYVQFFINARLADGKPEKFDGKLMQELAAVPFDENDY